MIYNINKAYTFFLLVFIFTQNAYAQPPNDACGGAFPITADGTCYGPGLPETTTVGAADNWIGTVGCASNANEVWFSFTATQSQLDINITSGTLGGDIEFVLVASTGPCSGLGLAGSLCGASPLVGSINGLQIGTTYYYTINGSGADGTFTTCVTNIAPVPVAGQDCSAAAILCDASGFSQGTSSAGFGNQEVTTANSCWGAGGERQSKWFKFTIGCSGTLEFIINPVTNSNDYDWGLWDVTSDISCAAKGNTIACDWSGCPGATGTSSCPASETGANNTNGNGPGGCGGIYQAINAPINVTAGNTYALLVDNFTGSNDGFSLTFGGACGTGTAVIGPDANFTGSLDFTCYEYTGIKTCVTANSTYLWDYGDGTTSTGMNGSHTYALDGAYTVSLTVTDALGCTSTTSQTLDVGCVLLSVDFANVSAELLMDETVELNWITASEDENDFFSVERSENGLDFEIIGTKDGIGNSSVAHEYRFLDRFPIDGNNYYRLKQTDFSGESSYSKIIAVNRKFVLDEISIFPNPVKGNSVLSFTGGAANNTTIVISDLSGKVLMSFDYITQKGENTINLNTESMIKGMYLLTLDNGDKNKTIRFIKD